MTNKNTWEQEFDELYSNTVSGFDGIYHDPEGLGSLQKEVKSFISSLLADQKKKIVEKIQEMEGVMLADLYSMPDDDDFLYKSEIINKIKSK